MRLLVFIIILFCGPRGTLTNCSKLGSNMQNHNNRHNQGNNVHK